MYNVGIFIDIIFAVDIIVNFLTPIEKSNGDLDTNFKNIALKYITGMFAIDFISCLPTSVFSPPTNTYSTKSQGNNNLLRIARL